MTNSGGEEAEVEMDGGDCSSAEAYLWSNF